MASPLKAQNQAICTTLKMKTIKEVISSLLFYRFNLIIKSTERRDLVIRY